MNSRSWLSGSGFIVAAWALWSLDPIVVYLIGGEVNRFLLVGLGSGSGGLALGWYVVRTLRQFPRLAFRHIALIFIQAVLFGGLASVCYAYSVRYLNPGLVSVILRTQIGFAVIWAVLFLRERMHAVTAAGILLIFLANVTMLINAVVSRPGGLDQNASLIGWALAFGAALLWSGATVSGKELLKVISPLQLAGVRLFFAGLSMLVFFLITSGPGPMAALTGRQWALLAVQGVVTSGGGFVLYYYGLRRTNVHVASSLEPLAPFYTLLISYFWLHKTVTARDLVGILVLLSGAAVAVAGNVIRQRGEALKRP